MSVRDPKDPRPTLFKDKVLGPFFVHRVQWKIATKCNTSIEPVLEAPSTCYITLLRCFVKIWIQELHQQSWSKEFIALDALDSSASTPQKKIDAKVRPSGICWRTVSWASMIDCVARGRSLFDVNGPQRSSRSLVFVVGTKCCVLRNASKWAWPWHCERRFAWHISFMCVFLGSCNEYFSGIGNYPQVASLTST